MKRLAHAMATRLLPVKSSAPATTTSIRPSEKVIPPMTLVGPRPRPLSVMARVAKAAPTPMKAPASTERAMVLENDSRALATPRSRTLPAISSGE